MEYGEILRRRRTVREFAERELEPAAVERVLASALRGPSAGFTQGFGFLVLAGEDREPGPPHLADFRQEFGIPDGAQPIGAIAVGHRAPDLPPPRPYTTTDRRPPRSQLHHGNWRPA
ncbi:nitroreductase family protein [Kribbella sp. NPDC055110]